MEYSTAYRVQVFLTYGVGFLLVGIPAGVLLFLGLFALCNSIMNLTAFLFPRLLSKRAKQRTKTALTQSLMEHTARRFWKIQRRGMSKRQIAYHAFLIREKLDKESLHKPRKIDRNFFKKG